MSPSIIGSVPIGVIVTCFDDGKIRKTVYDQIADIVYINENDEKISADRFEVRSTRRIGPFLITY